FFVLLARHDPRPYLRTWTAAWLAQVLGLAALLGASRLGRHASFGFFLFFEALHGLLILAAAQNYGRAQELRRAQPLILVLLAAWSGAAPFLFADPRTLQATRFAVLATTYLASAATLWPMREPAGMGLRLTTNVLLLLGLLHLGHGVAFGWSSRGD